MQNQYQEDEPTTPCMPLRRQKAFFGQDQFLSLFYDDAQRIQQTVEAYERCAGDELCVICHDTEIDTEMVCTPVCHHSFHMDCISKWFRTCIDLNYPTVPCPLCRCQLPLGRTNSAR
eukprot:TRINITY_DN14850_c4_g1_i1.p1 TRINITY_DN14850_c4_g1~~TRINITY_DN14850_c4_g1_i1.p1  ORF type:complete len:117 (+),score=6.38 TRINITY_DN14850_c4_g1_i1:68-418(+)